MKNSLKNIGDILPIALAGAWRAKKAARGFDATSGEFEQWVENRVRKNAINNNTGTLLYFPTRYREGSTPHNAAPFAVVGYGGMRALDTGGCDAEGGADTQGSAVAHYAGGSGAICET